jgi:hypothetical protein
MRAIAIAGLLGLLIVPQVFSNPRQDNPLAQDQILFGNVSIRGALNGNIVVIVDVIESAGRSAEESPNIVFRYAPYKRKSRNQQISFDYPEARVFYTDDRLAVIASDGHVALSLSLDKIRGRDAAFPIYGDRSTDLPDTVRISKGIGLQRQTLSLSADKTAPINLEQEIVVRDEFRTQDYEPELPLCSSGGVGSGQCSSGCGGQTCSVTCRSGYYACCYCSGDGSSPNCNCRRG